MVLLYTRYAAAIKQLMPKKPIEVGLKIWAIACSSSGYCWSFAFYQGSRDPIWSLAKTLEQGYVDNIIFTPEMDFKSIVLVCDNYFTQIGLFVALAHRGIWTVGMIKHWRPKKDPKEVGTACPSSECPKSWEP